MVEYSHTDVKRKRSGRKTSTPVVIEQKHTQIVQRGHKITPFDDVHVYSGEGKVELWWTDFGRLVIRTFNHEEKYHADIDAVDLVRGLQSLCRKYQASISE